jgi:hypothetical protein
MVKGIKDLIQTSQTEFAKELIERDAKGNWYSSMNVSNLILGKAKPKDPYTYVIISEILNVELEEIIKRFSNQ